MTDIITSNIVYRTNSHSELTTPAYLARPAPTGGAPGVVVIQEWWGLVPHIKRVTERFAEAGFVALAPDLYHGQAAEEPDEARKLAMALDRERAVQEILAASRYLRSLEEVAPKKIGVVGWCMGGGLALSTAAQGSAVDAAVAFYGRPLAPEDTPKIGCPVLGLFAEHDHGIPVEVVQAFEKEMEKNRIPNEVHIYPGTQHAFFNDSRPHIYNPEAAEDAWKRTITWFNRYLR
jgi:carboxymethylenebutenolidase